MTVHWRHTLEGRKLAPSRPSCAECDRVVDVEFGDRCSACLARGASGVAQLAQACTDSYSHADRDSLWQAVQGALIMAASVPGAGGAGGGKVKDDSVLGRKPPGESADWVKYANAGDPAWWHREYMRFPHHWIKCEVIRRAGQYLASLERRPDKLYDICGNRVTPADYETDDDLNDRIVAEGRGYSIEECIKKFDCLAGRIRRVRRAAGCDVENGEPLPDAAGAKPGRPTKADVIVLHDRRERVREMRLDDNLSVRAIAMRLRVAPTTVHRDLEWLARNRRLAS